MGEGEEVTVYTDSKQRRSILKKAVKGMMKIADKPSGRDGFMLILCPNKSKKARLISSGRLDKIMSVCLGHIASLTRRQATKDVLDALLEAYPEWRAALATLVTEVPSKGEIN